MRDKCRLKPAVRLRQRAFRAATVLLLAGLPSACSFSPDLRTCAGAPRCDREPYVAARAAAPALPDLPDGPASLSDLLALVECGSVSVHQARAQVRQAAAAVRAARAELLPKVAVDLEGFAYARAPGQDGFTTDPHVLGGMIDLSVPLDASGRLAEGVRAAQARYRSRAERLRAEGRAQRMLVAQAYFDLLEAIDLLAVNESAIAVEVRALKDGRAKLEAGVVRKNDVLVIEVALSNSRQRSVALESAVLEARRALNGAAGLPIARVTEVAPFAGLIPVEPDVLPLLDRARRDNPDVDVLVETRTALLHEIRAKAREDLPDVSLGPRLSGTTESSSDPRANFAGFLSVSWNPDLNGKLLAEKKGLCAQLVEVAWEVTGVLRRIEAAILRAHRDTVEKTSALRAAETSVEQARENLRIVFEQFRAGTATGREILEAQALLTQQEGTVKAARHGVNRSQFELHELAGVDPFHYAAEAAALPASRPDSRAESR